MQFFCGIIGSKCALRLEIAFCFIFVIVLPVNFIIKVVDAWVVIGYALIMNNNTIADYRRIISMILLSK